MESVLHNNIVIVIIINYNIITGVNLKCQELQTIRGLKTSRVSFWHDN